MKAKLLHKVRCRAKFCAHVNSITRTTDLSGEYITGVTIGYSISDNEPYKNIWYFGMDEEEFDREVRQIYWSLHKEEYSKYRKRKINKKL